MYVQSEPINTIAHTALTCSTASQQALASRAARMYALLVNDSDTAIYAALSATSTGVAAAATGIRINANGGSYEMGSGISNLYCGWIFAMSTTANKSLLITEGY
jgi:hypothetical protein